jgi:hypothetical protein
MLLYVGITSRGQSRNREHNQSKDWWRFVTTQSVEHHPSRPEALRRERALIRQFRPPFNTVHNPDHAATRQAYLDFRASGGRPSELAGAVSKQRRVEMDVSQSGDVLFMRYSGSLVPLIRPQNEPFPISGARHEAYLNDGSTIVIRARVKGQRVYKSARLMYRVDSQRPLQLSVKRVDLSPFEPGEVSD